MSRHQALNDKIAISKEIWDWAKTNPAFSELIEILEDLEDLRQAKKESGQPISIADVIARYEKLHNLKLNV